MEDLAPRQREVLEFIQDFLQQHEYPPALRDIARHLGISGNAAVLSHLEALEKKGYIRREPGSSRGIVLKQDPRPDFVSIPIVGQVRAGLPALAFEDIEGYCPLERMQLRGGTFFLRVRGDSMVNDAIVDGDLALVRPQETAQNGDLVVALVDGDATLKRFYRDGGGIRLMPRNPNYEPIVIPAGGAISIIGKVVKVIRDFE